MKNSNTGSFQYLNSDHTQEQLPEVLYKLNCSKKFHKIQIMTTGSRLNIRTTYHDIFHQKETKLRE